MIKFPLTTSVFSGPSRELTEREKELILLISQGYSKERIAQHCQISIHSINSCLTTLRHKLNVDTTAQAVGAAYLRGYMNER